MSLPVSAEATRSPRRGEPSCPRRVAYAPAADLPAAIPAHSYRRRSMKAETASLNSGEA
jgi:hypothetical protein